MAEALEELINPYVYAEAAALILEHRTTLVFVNTRRVAERVMMETAAPTDYN